MGYWLGVDLGTTRTAAAIRIGDQVRIAPLGSRTAEIPSAVYFAPDGSVLVGEAAVRRGTADPARLATEFKRRIGDSVPLFVAGAPHPAHLLMARLLGWVVGAISEQQGAPPDGVTVTYPANWGPFKRELFDQVLRLADLPQGLTEPEPVAAAAQFAAGERVQPGEYVAVYDLGGGTFDAAVLRKSDGANSANSRDAISPRTNSPRADADDDPGGDHFELLGRPDGIEQLGGVDFDDAVFQHVLRALGDPADLDPLDPAVTAALARLRRDCSEAKEGLSYDTEVVIPVALPGRHTQVLLHRSEFEDMIRPALGSTVECLLRTIRSAGIEPQQLRAVLLTGGSSRIPLVRQLVSDAVRRPVVQDAAPEHSIALGASRLVARQSVSRPGQDHGASAPTEQIPLPVPPGGQRSAGDRGGSPSQLTPHEMPPVEMPPNQALGSQVPSDRAQPDRGALRPGPAGDRGTVGVAPSGRRHRRRIWIAAGATVVVVAGAAIVTTTLIRGSGTQPGLATVGTSSVSSLPSSAASGPAESESSQMESSQIESSQIESSQIESSKSSGLPSSADPASSAGPSVQDTVLPATSLLVARGASGENGLYAVDSVSGRLGPRMPTSGVERPLISPDRQRMIYIETYAADEAELWIARVDGSDEQRVFPTRLPGCDRYLVGGWNPVEPDQLVLPCLAKDGRFTLRIVRLDGSVVHEFDLGGQFVDGATFAPDGRAVAFNSAAEGETKQSIYTAPVDGSTPPTRLTSGDNDVAPTWSPDGRQIVLMRESPADSGTYSIVVMNADGSDQRVVGAQDGADDLNPAWSTDGRSIVFRSDRGQQPRVSYRFWVMDANGTNPRELLPGDTGEALSTPGWARR